MDENGFLSLCIVLFFLYGLGIVILVCCDDSPIKHFLNEAVEKINKWHPERSSNGKPPVQERRQEGKRLCCESNILKLEIENTRLRRE